MTINILNSFHIMPLGFIQPKEIFRYENKWWQMGITGQVYFSLYENEKGGVDIGHKTIGKNPKVGLLYVKF